MTCHSTNCTHPAVEIVHHAYLCDGCANRARQGEPRITEPHIEHGTPAGTQAHQRNKTPVCAPCRQAERNYARAARARTAFHDLAA